MKKMVSIVAPAYKHERYIEECILSIANQTYLNKELILIDDLSPDNTATVIQNVIEKNEVKDKFSNIIFIKHEINKGAHYSINEGLGQASGDYFTIINTDDLYELNRIEEMMKILEKTKAQICFTKVDTINQDSEILRNDEWEYYCSLQRKIEQYPTINLALLTDNVAISTGNLLFTKELFKKIGGFKDYKYIHDWDFLLKSTLITEPVYVENTNYLYRLHETNSFKELQKDEELCYKESLEVLSSYCRHIKEGKYLNPCIPKRDVWQYFIDEIICNPDIGHIWKYA